MIAPRTRELVAGAQVWRTTPGAVRHPGGRVALSAMPCRRGPHETRCRGIPWEVCPQGPWHRRRGSEARYTNLTAHSSLQWAGSPERDDRGLLVVEALC